MLDVAVTVISKLVSGVVRSRAPILVDESGEYIMASGRLILSGLYEQIIVIAVIAGNSVPVITAVTVDCAASVFRVREGTA